MDPLFQILVHAPLYTSLRRLPEERQSRFRRLVDRLRAGRWDGGTRVKKLQGVPKPVFEARQDEKDRLLFTLARSAPPESSERLRTYLQIWDLVHHDRVTARASRINLSAEAEFLDYREIETETITDPPPHPAASFAEIPAVEAGGEAGVLELMIPPEEWRPREREEIVGGVRWYLVPDRLLAGDDDWQALMDQGAEELELKLTAEQYAVVRAPGPVLLSGSAGSGKTTIAAHRLAAAAGAPHPGRTLYVTYSPWLLDYARRLFRDLLLCRGERVAGEVDFLTMDDLYRTLIARGGGKPPGRVADYPEFSSWYRRAVGNREAALAWEEIRSIVKGACLDPRRTMLHRGEYEALGRKRAPLFENRRERIYPIARRWQKHLEESRRVDEIDLCRMALAGIRPGDGYDHLVCDEVQDLAEIQVELLLRLHRGRDFQGLFLSGDPQQVINPSGFRWAEVRTAIRRRFLDAGRPAPDLHVLTRNFRSVRGLVDLANEVLALKRERTGRSEGDESEESTVAGAAPILVVGAEAALAEAARGFGPRCAVVTGSPALRDRLQRQLDTTRIFLVPEVKGLEFDVVILWGFLAADPGPWRRLLDPGLDLREDPACRRALHHLYVALTRARRHLAVYEPPDAPPLWTSDRFRTKLDPEPPDSLSRLFARSAAPEEWIREGDYFLKRQRYRQAAECFRRGGDELREAECLALHHESVGEPGVAAERWLALERWDRAGECLESSGRYQEAAEAWSRASEEGAADRCRIRAAEAAGRWKEAAERWEERESWEEAARCWSRIGQRARRTACLARAGEAAGRFSEAARSWEEVGELQRAAAAWRRAGRERDALRAGASLHEGNRHWGEAAAVWERLGEGRRALRCKGMLAETEGRWSDAARLWEELEEFPTALRAWKRAGAPDEARRCGLRIDLAAGRFVRAAEAYEEMGDFQAAASCWNRAFEAGQSPPRPLPLPFPQAARNAWAPGCPRARLLGRYGSPDDMTDPETRALVCEVRAAEDAGRFDLAEEVWATLRDRGQALRCRVRGLEARGRIAEAAALLEERGKLEAARGAWLRAGHRDRARRCEAINLEKGRRFEQAAGIWEEMGDRKGATRCRGRILLRRGDYEEAARLLGEAGDEKRALEARILAAQAAGDWRGAERILKEAGRLEELRFLRLHRREWLAQGRWMADRRRKELVREAGRANQRRARELAEWARSAQLGLFPGKAGPGPGKFIRRKPGREGSARRGPAARLEERVLASVARFPGQTCEELMETTGLPPIATKRILKKLVHAGSLEKTGRTRGTRYWVSGSLPESPV